MLQWVALRNPVELIAENTKAGASERVVRAIKSKSLSSLRIRRLIETSAEDFLRILKA